MFAIFKKLGRFPCGAWYVLAGKCIDTFVWYALVGLFYLYMTAILKFSEMTAMEIYETSIALSIVTNFVTAYLADSRVGKFRVLIAGCVLQALACAVLTASALTHLAYAMPLAMIGVGVRALGSGAIIPTLPTLGGDQFDSDNQDLLPTFFITLYFFDKVGSIMGLVVYPKLRALPCLDKPTCFPLAFGLETVLAVLLLLVVLAGRAHYVLIQPMQNGLVLACRVVANGVRRVASRSLHRRESSKMMSGPDRRLKADTRHFLGLFLLFTPFPCFWALQQQQNSRWIYQGKRMDGDVLGANWLVIEPEQMEVAGPIMAVLLIPFFDRVLYPTLAKVGLLRTPLPRMCVGMCLAVVSFLVSAQIERAVSPVDPVLLEPQQAGMRVFNGASCAAVLRIGDTQYTLPAHALTRLPPVHSTRRASTLRAHLEVPCATPTKILAFLTLRTNYNTVFVVTAPVLSLRECFTASKVHKSPTGNVRVGVVVAASPAPAPSDTALLASSSDTSFELLFDPGACASRIGEVRYNDQYTLVYAGSELASGLQLRRGGVYLVFVFRHQEALQVTLETVTPFNELNMLWQLPQIAAISVAEIFFTVTGNEFAYTQAPPAMRTLVRAAWGMTRGLGSLMVIVVTQALSIETVIQQLYAFAALLAANVLLFIFLAWRYKPRQVEPDEDEDEDETHAMAVADS